MTREILFRGKRLDNGEWVYGAYHKHDTVKVCITGDDPKTKHIIIADGFCDWGFEPPLMGYYVDPSTVGQFTGLTANGKKIFEGDIIKYHEPFVMKATGIVRFGENRWNANTNVGFYMEWVIAKIPDILRTDLGFWCNERGVEVIGNVVDNPELLEE